MSLVELFGCAYPGVRVVDAEREVGGVLVRFHWLGDPTLYSFLVPPPAHLSDSYRKDALPAWERLDEDRTWWEFEFEYALNQGLYGWGRRCADEPAGVRLGPDAVDPTLVNGARELLEFARRVDRPSFVGRLESDAGIYEDVAVIDRLQVIGLSGLAGWIDPGVPGWRVVSLCTNELTAPRHAVALVAVAPVGRHGDAVLLRFPWQEPMSVTDFAVLARRVTLSLLEAGIDRLGVPSGLESGTPTGQVGLRICLLDPLALGSWPESADQAETAPASDVDRVLDRWLSTERSARQEAAGPHDNLATNPLVPGGTDSLGAGPPFD